MKRKFIAKILVAAMVATYVAIPVIQTDAKEDNTAVEMSTRAITQTTSIANSIFKVNVAPSGSFSMNTVGGHPDNPNDDNKKLLFGNSNLEAIKVGDTLDIIDTGSTGYNTAKWDEVDVENNKVISKYSSSLGLDVKRTISLGKSQNSSYEDAAFFNYEFKNTTNAPITFSFKNMLDTYVGNNDSAPFNVNGYGPTSKRIQYEGEATPKSWFAYDNLANPTAVSQFSYHNSSEPSRVQFTNWGTIANSQNWVDNVNEGNDIGDSCVVSFWNDIVIQPGESKTISYNYGVGSLNSQTEAGLGLGLINNNATIVANEDGTYPNYSTTATIENSGEINLTDITLTIDIPEEFKNLISLLNPQATSNVINVGDLAVGESVNINLDFAISDIELWDDIAASINVSVDSAETNASSLTQNLTIQANMEHSISAYLHGGNVVEIAPNEDNAYDNYEAKVTVQSLKEAVAEALNLDEEDVDLGNVKLELVIPEEFKNDIALAEDEEAIKTINVADGATIDNVWNLVVSDSFNNREVKYEVKVTYVNEPTIELNQTLKIAAMEAPEVPVVPEEPTTPEVKPTEPVKTGDPSNVAGLLSTALLSLGGIVATRKKYNSKH